MKKRQRPEEIFTNGGKCKVRSRANRLSPTPGKREEEKGRRAQMEGLKTVGRLS